MRTTHTRVSQCHKHFLLTILKQNQFHKFGVNPSSPTFIHSRSLPGTRARNRTCAITRSGFFCSAPEKAIDGRKCNGYRWRRVQEVRREERRIVHRRTGFSARLLLAFRLSDGVLEAEALEAERRAQAAGHPLFVRVIRQPSTIGNEGLRSRAPCRVERRRRAIWIYLFVEQRTNNCTVHFLRYFTRNRLV